MDWVQFATFLIANISFSFILWLLNRAESRIDTRQIIDLITAIQQEIKDFHGRLCTIEERNKK